MVSKKQCRGRVRACRSAMIAILIAMASTAVAQGLREPSAWEVLVPRYRPVDSVLWAGRVAVADDGGGLLVFDTQNSSVETWTTQDGLSTNLLTSVDADSSGRLWIGTRGGGVIRIDGAGVTRSITGLLESAVTDLAVDGDLVYYGTLSGAGRIASGFPEQVFQTGDGLPANEVRVVAAYGGIAWFGTPEGVGQFDRGTNQLMTRNQGLGPNLEVLDLRSGFQGTYVATVDGVFEWEGSQWNALPPAPSTVRRLVLIGDRILGFGAGDLAWEFDPMLSTWSTLTLDGANYNYSSGDNTGREQFPGAVRVADGTVYYVATVLTPGLIRSDPLTTIWKQGGVTPVTVRGLFGLNVRGLATDGQGGAWYGAFPVFDGVTHWRADGSVVAYALRDDDPLDANDAGWIRALKIAAFVDSRGALWVSTFQNGVTRLQPSANEDPSTATYLHLLPGDSPFQSRRVVAMAEDSQGRVWFASDGQSPEGDINVGIDVLLDPTDPLSPASWQKIAPSNSLIGGPGVTAIDFLGGNTVWLSVNGVGIQSWDYGGSAGSGDIEVSSFLDASAWRTISRLPDTDSGIELTAPRGLEFGVDGMAWLATEGAGVFRFDPDSSLQPWEVDQIRVSPFGVTLLSNSVRSIALDARGALWAATDAGLDRIVSTTEGYRVDSFTDLLAFESRDLGQAYLPDILSPLPGSNVNTLALDTVNQLLFVATQTGAARVDLGRLVSTSTAAFGFSVHPNPVRAQDVGVVVGSFEGEATVEIYNLLGVLMLRRTGVRAGDQVWDARDRLGENVASGMYVLRLETSAGSTQRTVAIER